MTDARFVPDDGNWTLIFVRDLRHPPTVVWRALTDPAELDRWAPFTPSRDLASTGAATLTTVDGDTRDDLPATVRRAEEPTVLEYTWGDDLLRWELEPAGDGTRLTLRHTMADRDMGPSTAAGWQICTDQLASLLDGGTGPAIRGRAAADHGWAELRDAYAGRFGG